MKISIAWVFDHIEADWRTYAIDDIVTLFNQKVAEIEGYYQVHIPLQKLFVAQVTEVEEQHVILSISETNQTIELPERDGMHKGQMYLVKKNGADYHWATAADFGGQEDMLPVLSCDQTLAAGEWRNTIDQDDWIIEVDNKSITHRPDMWGHRGFAREIALLLNLKLKPIDQLITHVPFKTYENESVATDDMPYSVRIVDTDKIDRFALAYFSHIENKHSLPWMASRLSKVDARPIDALVDMTNYVMLDISQPTHAFDARKIETTHIQPRLAHEDEQLKLLDGDLIELSKNDIVISDGQKPIALGGIMGGKETEVDMQTDCMVLESAHFDATTVRLTAARHKKRTEASARFEKTIDPNQNVIAVERFVRLLHDAHIPFQLHGAVSVGSSTNPIIIMLSHSFIQDRLGTTIETSKVHSILEALGCQSKTEVKEDTLLYHITVPTFRCTKDITGKEDIVEEVARIYGYPNIPYQLPKKSTQPQNVQPILRLRSIKRVLAYGYHMKEVYNYGFFDEAFLHELQWQPEAAARVQNPVSQNWQTLTTSLIPGLIKNVCQNNADRDRLRFFEVGRVWHADSDGYHERMRLAGIWYNKKEQISFYTIKQVVQHLATMLQLPLTYKKVDDPFSPWFAPYQTADVMHADRIIGQIGLLDAGFTHTVFEGYAAAFTFDVAFLQSFDPPVVQVQPTSKYPAVERDISMLVPLRVTVAQLTNTIENAHSYIKQVQLIDMFQKDDWHDRKSLTFSFMIQDPNKTLTAQEADALYEKVVQSVKPLGAEIR